MRVTRLLFIPLFFVLSVLGHFTQRSHGSLSSAHKAKRIPAVAGNDTLEKRDNTKLLEVRIFLPHASHPLIQICRSQPTDTYPYTQSDWADDIARIGANSVDALALNIGDDDWQLSRIQDAYAAAVGTNMKLFISFDYTAFACDVSKTISYINQFKSHPNQFYYNGKVMVSSYSGDCLGTGGWQAIQSSTNAYLMPFIWGLEGSFGSTWSFLDSWLCWGCAWPQGDYDKSTSDDQYYMSQLGSRYATTISMWIFTHFSWANKNFYLRGDDWLIANRWEQLISMRDQLTFVEMVTWNDYGESDYFGPFKGAQPDGTYWAENFPHTIFYDLSQYYITAFKTGSYPAITQDVIYYWARPHPYAANAYSDSLGKPTGWDWATDSLWALVFATSSASVTLQIGGSSQTFSVGAGATKLSIPLDYGQITVQMVRNSQTVISQTDTGFTYIANPSQYNYNAYGNAASSTATSTSSTSTTATSTTAAATSTSTSWQSIGCIAEGTTGRALAGPSYVQDGMTPAICTSLCSAYDYAGMEYGKECYCGNSYTSNGASGAIISSSSCNVMCDGDSSQPCGGSWVLNLWGKGDSGSSSSSSSFSYYGCIAEGSSGRALTGASYKQSGMTAEVCQNLCADYTYAATEYAEECYCGNSITQNGASGAIVDSSQCWVPCDGNNSEICGGSWYLSVYAKGTSASSWTNQGCYTDSADRLLRGSLTTISGLTTNACISSCSAAGYTMAATEYSYQCLCGSTLYHTGGAGSSTSSSDCNMSCQGEFEYIHLAIIGLLPTFTGDSTQQCGGSYRANLYTAPGTALSRREAAPTFRTLWGLLI
ncbi:glycosyl hydrolase family 71-domain-containing protein [Armillaria novae-zelandiae]|uniref:Glycosyl hydrolase family 71-domain-containing protein n=1 Tax=Armillaria novae-zelandiae TaxID=153914 RepID=A0AA39PXD5_9AGAR|nr:glycosyl hydrolase family 71-domain-containing protein [Armillaria novae-zelandiae]